ncbi:MAG: S8 family serine peptidase [Elainella sp. Prado103]|jgi:hypothetical protein|nr:S8 family serine peptidase [Elainella sp. Prado103]
MLDLDHSGLYRAGSGHVEPWQGQSSSLNPTAIDPGLNFLSRSPNPQSLSPNWVNWDALELEGFCRDDQFNNQFNDRFDVPDHIRIHSRVPHNRIANDHRLLQSAQDAAASAERDVLAGLSTGSLQENQARSRTVAMRRIRSGQLEADDLLNPTRIDRYRDDYLLRTPGGQVTVQLNSPDFDAYLQIINPTTGRVVAEDDDSGLGFSAQLSLPTQAGVDYVVRVTSFRDGAIGKYQLVANPTGNAATAISPLVPFTRSIPSPDFARFQNADGYGLVDAAAAVSRAIGSAQFASLPDLGGNNWGNDLVNAPEVWQRGFDGRGVVVAVIDTGVDDTHFDLNDNIWMNSGEIAGNGIDDDSNGFVDDLRGWNFMDNNNQPIDDQGHGTHVAGTIAAENNGVGVTGVAYDAQIMPVKVLDRFGQGNTLSIAAGIRYAAANGADVINLSLGGALPSNTIRAAIRAATAQGVVVVMAAGNESRLIPGYPARYAVEAGISVGAVDSTQAIPSFSNRAGFDSNLRHVVAPGVGVTSTLPGHQYGTYSGTSMAAPHVAGVAALMLSANASLTPEQVRQLITSSATRIDL